MDQQDIAVAHEHYPARGGGEVVADALADTFDAQVVTGWVGDESATDHEPIELLGNSAVSFLRPLMGTPLVRDPFYMFAFESAPVLREYDTVIQSGNAPMWYVPNQDQTIVKYNHSPPRNPFDLFWRESSHTASKRDLIDPRYVVDRLYKKACRHLWKNRTDAVDLWVCNSEVVAHRTRKYLGVADDKITVVYPPVDVATYEPSQGGDYYLALGRLEPSKHTEALLATFDREVDGQLKIAGDGNQFDRLQSFAANLPSVDLLGYVSDDRKRELYRNATALLFAAENEDFGLVPIEAMAAGTPVIGVRDGFTKHQIEDGTNGLLFDDRDPATIGAAIRRFEREGVAWDAAQLHQFAQQFSRERFDREMRTAVEAAQQRSTIQPDVSLPDAPAEPALTDGGGDDV